MLVSKYEEAIKFIQSGDFDAILTDLMMPVEGEFMEEVLEGDAKKYLGIEEPIGIGIFLLALQSNAKFVGVLTDGSRHTHPTFATIQRSMSRHVQKTHDKSFQICEGYTPKDWKTLLERLTG